MGHRDGGDFRSLDLTSEAEFKMRVSLLLWEFLPTEQR